MAAARTRLILDKPFLGALALRLPLVESVDGSCRTTRCDARNLYYHRAYIDALDIDQTQFALSRESLHCALLHFYRRGNRQSGLWDRACDLAVNSILIRDGLKPTPDTVYRPEFDGMTAEEIYPLLVDEAATSSEPDRAAGAGDRAAPDRVHHDRPHVPCVPGLYGYDLTDSGPHRPVGIRPGEESPVWETI